MTYREALEYFHSALRFGMRPGTGPTEALLAELGHPEKKLKFVHVAGTSGKGSTAAMIASALTAAGYRTGGYFSPYVEDFRERITIDGEMISPDDLAHEAEIVREAAGLLESRGMPPFTEFVLVTAAAIDYYLRRRCDAVVLETGLGGKHDSTNAIPAPLASVICSIGLDHTDILGNTIEEIAWQKCGIIKPGGLTVCYPEQDERAAAVIRARCEETGNPLHIPDLSALEIAQDGLHGTVFSYRDVKLGIPLVGRHQVLNAVTAFETLRALKNYRGFDRLCDEAIKDGFSRVSCPARFEVLSEEPLVILDGAHNPPKIEACAAAIENYVRRRPLIALMGMLSDKDYRWCIDRIASLCDVFIALPVKDGRVPSLPPEEAAAIASIRCPSVSCRLDYTLALTEAMEKAGREGAVVVCGSLYLAGGMRKVAREVLKRPL